MATIKIHRGMDWPQLVSLPTGVTHDDYINVKVELIDAANKRIARFSKETLAGHEAIITEADATHLLIPIEQYWTSQLANGAYYIKIVYVYTDARFADGDRDEGNSYYVFTVVAESEATNPEDVTVIAYGDHIEAGLMTGAQIVAAINEELESEDWQESGVGGASATNLSYTASATQGVVVSDTGNDATIPAATTQNAGLLLPAEKSKLASLDTRNGAPVQNTTELIAISVATLSDKEKRFVENEGGDFYYDAQSTGPADSDHLAPTNQVGGVGFWIRIAVGASETAASIKTKYESNADTNAFTNAEKSKLAAIEANATADMTAAEIKTAYESNADTNAYTTAEKAIVAAAATLKIATLTNVANVIAVDCESKFGFEASNVLTIGTAAAINIANAPALGYINLDVIITGGVPLTFPSGSISGDLRIVTRVFTPTATGSYSISIKIIGSVYKVLIEQNPAA